MRLSVRKDDLGYIDPFPFGKVKITLDDADVTDKCFTADEELGEVCVYKLNSDGQRYFDRELNEIPCETLKGDVKIVLDNGGSDA